MFNEKNISENCEIAKNALDSRLKETWNKINSTERWGCLTYLYKRYGQPESIAEFYYDYVNDFDDDCMMFNYEESPNPKEIGRSREFIYQVAEFLQELDDNKEQLDTYYWYIIYKLIYCTFNGCKAERKAKEIIESKMLETKIPTIDEDSKYGIDLKVYNNGKYICNIQVKPDTFFKSNKESNCKRRIFDYNKTTKATEKFRVPTYYMIYSKNTGNFIKNDNNKFLFKWSDLVDNNGYIN